MTTHKGMSRTKCVGQEGGEKGLGIKNKSIKAIIAHK